MKRIYFKHIENNLFFLIGLGFFSVTMITLGVLQIFLSDTESEFERFISIFIVIVCVGLIIFLWRTMPQFRSRHYVQWNKHDIALRINSKWGKSIPFKDIISTELKGEKLVLKKNYNKEIHVDLTDFQDADIMKLYEIILQNTKPVNPLNA